MQQSEGEGAHPDSERPREERPRSTPKAGAPRSLVSATQAGTWRSEPEPQSPGDRRRCGTWKDTLRVVTEAPRRPGLDVVQPQRAAGEAHAGPQGVLAAWPDGQGLQACVRAVGEDRGPQGSEAAGAHHRHPGARGEAPARNPPVTCCCGRRLAGDFSVPTRSPSRSRPRSLHRSYTSCHMRPQPQCTQPASSLEGPGDPDLTPSVHATDCACASSTCSPAEQAQRDQAPAEWRDHMPVPAGPVGPARGTTGLDCGDGPPRGCTLPWSTGTVATGE